MTHVVMIKVNAMTVMTAHVTKNPPNPKLAGAISHNMS